jgi:hypothetical protein
MSAEFRENGHIVNHQHFLRRPISTLKPSSFCILQQHLKHLHHFDKYHENQVNQISSHKCQTGTSNVSEATIPRAGRMASGDEHLLGLLRNANFGAPTTSIEQHVGIWERV